MSAADPAAEANPLGMRGIEFIEYLSRHPDELGAVLAQLGFRLIARHRSREVFLYRQGPINVIINADPVSLSALRTPRRTTRSAPSPCAWPTPTRPTNAACNGEPGRSRRAQAPWN